MEQGRDALKSVRSSQQTGDYTMYGKDYIEESKLIYDLDHVDGRPQACRRRSQRFPMGTCLMDH
jgi:hypothetical protein